MTPEQLVAAIKTEDIKISPVAEIRDADIMDYFICDCSGTVNINVWALWEDFMESEELVKVKP